MTDFAQEFFFLVDGTSRGTYAEGRKSRYVSKNNGVVGVFGWVFYDGWLFD